MSSRLKANLDRLHHAYGILRQHENQIDSAARLLGFFKNELNVAIKGNPDFFHEKFETLTIDDSRRIKEFAFAKRFSAEMPRIFLLEIYGATREAQNALLKLFEEPEEGNHFFLVVPSFDILLPTLRSRLSFTNPIPSLVSDKDSVSVPNDAMKVFLKSSIKDKIAFVDALAADISDGKKAKHEALSFINDLEKTLYQHQKRNIPALEAIARARTYMNDRGPSIKMLLEYAILNL